jgi:ABC-type uncharacterized transport system permease subunit
VGSGVGRWRWLGGFFFLFFFFQTKKVKEGWMIQCFGNTYFSCSRIMCQPLIGGHKALIFCQDRTEVSLDFFLTIPIAHDLQTSFF